MENSEIAAQMTAAIEKAGGLDKSVKFDFDGEGAVWAQGKEAKVSDDDADCVISVSKDDFLALAKGELDPMMAFMSGKLKVAGDMSVAMGLQSIFSNM